MDTEKESCNYCEFVDRGYDDCSHEVFWISDRCPFYELIKMLREHKVSAPPFEYTTRYTGCKKFKEDIEYRTRNEELDKMLEEMRKKHETQQ